MDSNYSLSIDEWNDLSAGLAGFHNIFYRFWTVCRPVFNDAIKTAAVAFDKDGNCVEFMLNREFWNTLTPAQKLFVICHECLHLILNHGKRGRRLFAKGEAERLKLNIAMDICVNEALVERYGFDRNEIDPTNKYVWADKVAAALELPNLPTNRCFEYYYNLFKKQPDAPFQSPPSGGSPAVGETVDDHTDQGENENEGSDALESVAGVMDEGERQSLDNMLRDERNTLQNDTESHNMQAGSDPLGHTFKLKVEKVAEKKKWETIITEWAKKKLTDAEKDDEQWARTARRFSLLDRRLSLPYEMEVEAKTQEKHKIDVWFFLDTSGSCIQLADRFFAAARTLPKARFNVNLYCFDTKIYPSSLVSRQVRGGGGTKFDIIERYIVQHTIKEGKKYPDGVFIITDGLGNEVKPKHPKVWHWFLSEQHTMCIPKESKRYNLWEFT